MKKVDKTIRNGNTGITLIALVVTIVVLLILASVAISITFGKDGLIAKAQEAAIIQEVADIKDTISMELGNISLEENQNNKKIDDNVKLNRIYDKIQENNLNKKTQRVGNLIIVDNRYVVSMTTGQDAVKADSSVWNYYTWNNWKGYSDTDCLNFGFITGYKGTDKTITIPEYVLDGTTVCPIREIRQNWDAGFTNNDNIEEIIISDNIVKIEQTEFASMKNLRKVTLSDTVADISNNVFASCFKLQECNIPSSLKIISDLMFYRDYALKAIEIPNNVTEIEKEAFSLCLSIEKIEVPSSVKKIDEKAFEYMGINDSIPPYTGEGTSDTDYKTLGYVKGSLKQIILNEGLQEIGDKAFTISATVEKDLKIPSTVTTIGTDTFLYFGKLGGGKLYNSDGSIRSTN